MRCMSPFMADETSRRSGSWRGQQTTSGGQRRTHSWLFVTHICPREWPFVATHVKPRDQVRPRVTGMGDAVAGMPVRTPCSPSTIICSPPERPASTANDCFVRAPHGNAQTRGFSRRFKDCGLLTPREHEVKNEVSHVLEVDLVSRRASDFIGEELSRSTRAGRGQRPAAPRRRGAVTRGFRGAVS